MTRRIEPDDEVHRFRAVWLGPPGTDLPFHIRYVAYGLWFGLFLVVLLIEAITPLPSGFPLPVWEFSMTVLATALVMQAVDHDKPVAAILANALWGVRARPTREPREHAIRPTFGTLVKITKESL